MQIIKPQNLGLLHKTYRFKQQDYFAATVLIHFNLITGSIIKDTEQWTNISKTLDQGDIFDQAMPKPNGEFLLAGNVSTPGKEPMQSCATKIQFGPLTKEINVLGDRVRTRNPVGIWRTSQPEAFTELPISWNRTYGGKSEQRNPDGIGRMSGAQWIFGSKENQLANFYDKQFSDSPVCTLPEKPDWKKRQKMSGTYDKKWQKEEYPGLARDIDWRYFNVAPADQQIKSYWKGNESFTLTNLHSEHPIICGKLPELNGRCFIESTTGRQSHDTEFKEIPLNLDTVWLFPNSLSGSLLFRGYCQVQDSDALDVNKILIAYENNVDARRTLQDYQTAMALKTNRETSAENAFNDALLSPKKPESTLIQEKQEDQQAEQAFQDKQQKAAQAINDKYAKGATAAVASHFTLKKLRKPTIPLPSPQSLERGDFSLLKTLQKTDRLVKKLTSLATRKQKQAEKELEKLKSINLKNLKADPANEQKSALSTDKMVSTALAAAVSSGQMSPQQKTALKLAVSQAKKTAAQSRAFAPLAEAPKNVNPEALSKQLKSSSNASDSIEGLDMSGIKLSGQFFKDKTFTNTQFEFAELTDCHFQNCQFDAAVFSNATLVQTTFEDCQLVNCNLESMKSLQLLLKNCQLTDCRMGEAQFKESRIQQSIFDKCIALKADFQHSQLTDCRFDMSVLMQANINDCDWINCQIAKSVFLDAYLQFNRWQKCTVDRCAWTGAKQELSTYNDCQLTEVQTGGEAFWTRSIVENCTLTTCGFREIAMNKLTLLNSALSGCDFAQSNLFQSVVKDSHFLNCVFSSADLSEIKMTDCNLYQGLCRKTLINNAALQTVKIVNSDCFEAQFIDTNLKYVDGLEKQYIITTEEQLTNAKNAA
ncbi:DUF2169 family type VI secretion system accessory protein [Aliikangiella coralliicola]|uniref:DUF2169 domain-containing protein n=1 Tax=Aliikangiella coralliicola TaxID=2592383 RepID=A0A545UCS0_9GAMM|nr:DUF2169 domain-containing protein [Aliikangiella coralliicola]TQV87264.1 DUF2169 domain-containing protein [Aliikangiella coralliicola]